MKDNLGVFLLQVRRNFSQEHLLDNQEIACLFSKFTDEDEIKEIKKALNEVVEKVISNSESQREYVKVLQTLGVSLKEEEPKEALTLSLIKRVISNEYFSKEENIYIRERWQNLYPELLENKIC